MIQNDYILELVRVVPISDKIVENSLRWFGHVQRSLDAPAKRVG